MRGHLTFLSCPHPPSHTSQVIQQALHRQPSTAAQYLQQMYAAQQQHLMLQTAALQQQHHLSSAQLQSLAAVQQVSDGATLVPRLVWKLDGSYMRVCGMERERAGVGCWALVIANRQGASALSGSSR